MIKQLIMNKKIASGCLICVFFAVSYTFFSNDSTTDILQKIELTGLTISPVVGEHIAVKREYLASHSSFWVLILAKAMGTSTVKKDAYLRMFQGTPFRQAIKEAVDNMPEDEIGLLFEMDGVLVELTRFRSATIAKKIAVLQTELLKKDMVYAQCDKPEYENRMTCSRMVYLSKKNFLFTISDIHQLIDIYDDNGRRIARDYEAVPEEDFLEVITALKNLM